MKKRITEYRKRVDRLLADEEEKTYEEWECILEEHLVQIGFFQHERLIHLIVTVTFAVITVLSLFAPLLTGIMTLYGFTMLLLVLLVPYIFHCKIDKIISCGGSIMTLEVKSGSYLKCN